MKLNNLVQQIIKYANNKYKMMNNILNISNKHNKRINNNRFARVFRERFCARFIAHVFARGNACARMGARKTHAGNVHAKRARGNARAGERARKNAHAKTCAKTCTTKTCARGNARAKRCARKNARAKNAVTPLTNASPPPCGGRG